LLLDLSCISLFAFHWFQQLIILRFSVIISVLMCCCSHFHNISLLKASTL
jgi:hypothetical protein